MYRDRIFGRLTVPSVIVAWRRVTRRVAEAVSADGWVAANATPVRRCRAIAIVIVAGCVLALHLTDPVAKPGGQAGRCTIGCCWSTRWLACRDGTGSGRIGRLCRCPHRTVSRVIIARLNVAIRITHIIAYPRRWTGAHICRRIC